MDFKNIHFIIIMDFFFFFENRSEIYYGLLVAHKFVFILASQFFNS